MSRLNKKLNTESVHPAIDSISDALSFQLARLVAIQERRGSHYFENTHDISLNQWRILGFAFALINKLPNKKNTASSQEIQNQLNMDKGQFSRTLKQLVQRGFLKTTPSLIDARYTELTLTKQGVDKHNQLLAFTRERNEAAVSVLSIDECAEFVRLLKKLSDHNETLKGTTGKKALLEKSCDRY